MSASSKKKLRNAQEAEKMTQKQQKEQAEAKKLKIYTTVFVVVLVLMVVIAAVTAVTRTVSHSGIMERNTVALTVGDHEISNAELNFFFVDAVNNFYSNYGSYASMFGLDTSLPLDEQVTNEETGATWADDFLDSAISNAKAVYALCDEAAAQGYTLSEEELEYIDSNMSYMQLYASYYGYSELDDYLKAMYGNGANEKTIRAYYETTYLAECYQNYYIDSLTYTDDDLLAAEEENPAQYSAFSYNSYYLSASKFLEGGTTDEEGNTTYSDEETAASVTAAEEAAKSLTACTTVEELDAAIAALSINAESTSAASTAYTDNAYSSIGSTILEWVTDSSREAGDITYIASTSTSTDDEGNETTTTNGYYVVLFSGSTDNNFPLANVRHILVPYEGGTTDDSGNTVYSDDEKAAAKAAAEELLASWANGDATEESFAALANENSTDTGSNTNGGLYEDVYPGQMVTNFNDWCFAEGRQAGDTGIVESDYGYHVMYYSGDSETTYRDYLITNDLVDADSEAWYNALIEAMTVTEKNMKYINTDLVLSSN